MGPNSRALLEAASGADLSNATHPFGAWAEIELGYARVRAHARHLCRRTRLGDSMSATEFARDVFDAILEAGAAARPQTRGPACAR